MCRSVEVVDLPVPTRDLLAFPVQDHAVVQHESTVIPNVAQDAKRARGLLVGDHHFLDPIRVSAKERTVLVSRPTTMNGTDRSRLKNDRVEHAAVGERVTRDHEDRFARTQSIVHGERCLAPDGLGLVAWSAPDALERGWFDGVYLRQLGRSDLSLHGPDINSGHRCVLHERVCACSRVPLTREHAAQHT